jgi:hypothetical protein
MALNVPMVSADTVGCFDRESRRRYRWSDAARSREIGEYLLPTAASPIDVRRAKTVEPRSVEHQFLLNDKSELGNILAGL